MNATTSIPVNVQIRRTRLFGLMVSVAAVAVAGTWAIVSTSGHSARTSVSAAHTNLVATDAVGAAPDKQTYVRPLTSMTPDALEAAFGTGKVDAIDALGLTPQGEKYLRAVTSMSPAELKATFGTGNGLAPQPERTSERSATFGTGKGLTPQLERTSERSAR